MMSYGMTRTQWVNTLRSEQNGCHFSGKSFKYLIQNCHILLQIHWSWFLKVQLTISQQWSGGGLEPNRLHAIILTNCIFWLQLVNWWVFTENRYYAKSLAPGRSGTDDVHGQLLWNYSQGCGNHLIKSLISQNMLHIKIMKTSCEIVLRDVVIISIKSLISQHMWLSHPVLGWLCFQSVSAASASAAAKTFPSHAKTVWAKPLIFGTKNIWVWGIVLGDLSMT